MLQNNRQESLYETIYNTQEKAKNSVVVRPVNVLQ